MSQPILQVQCLHVDAIVPTYAHSDDAGLDLHTVVACTLAPGERMSIPTGIAVQIPAEHVGLIWDKSGLSHKSGLKTLGGVIDAGYRGEIKVGVVNLGQEPYHFSTGDKVAQILIQKVEHPMVERVHRLADDSERGKGAFGSTGK